MKDFAPGRRIGVCLALAGAAAFGLIACASTSSVDRTHVAAGLSDRTRIDAAGLPAPFNWTAPPGTAIDDGLAIDEAVAIALWNNTAFQAALTSLGVARADVVQAGMLKNPVLSLLFPLGPKQFEAAATIAIDAIWQRPRRIADAKLNAEAVAETLLVDGLQLVADVKVAYIEALATERSLVLATQQAASSQQMADMAAGRLRAGDISDFEARQARSAATGWEATRIAKLSARDLTLVRLRSMLDLPFEAPALTLSSPMPTPSAACGDVPTLLKTALAARPDVRAAELRIDAAGVRAGLERDKIISFTATLDMNGEGKQGFEMGPGIGIELPILSQNQGGRAKAAADLEQASRRYLAVRSAVATEVQMAFIRLQEASQATAVLATLNNSVEEERRQARALRAAGEISGLALLEILQRLDDLEYARADAAAAAARAGVRLDQAVGRSCMRD